MIALFRRWFAESFLLRVDYDTPLTDLVRYGHYDHINADIISSSIAPSDLGCRLVQVGLFPPQPRRSAND